MRAACGWAQAAEQRPPLREHEAWLQPASIPQCLVSQGPESCFKAAAAASAPQGVACDAQVEHSSQVAGCGLLGVVEGRSLIVGTAELLASREVSRQDRAGQGRVR